jgi:glycerol-3-phosphate acyltransferase PlsY
MNWLLAAVAGVLLGSIPFGLALTRLAGLGDIRSIGSGNIGATNVLRTGRRDVAAAVLLLDALKGAVAVWVAAWIDPGMAGVGGVAAVIGHCFCPWLAFRGGKGVATGLGVALALVWPAGIAALLCWALAAWATRRSSAGALAAIAAAVVVAWIIGPGAIPPWTAWAVTVMAALIVLRHQGNIARLLAGTEPRIGAGK